MCEAVLLRFIERTVIIEYENKAGNFLNTPPAPNSCSQQFSTSTLFQSHHKNYWPVELDDKSFVLIAYVVMRMVLFARPQQPTPQLGPCSFAPRPSTNAMARVVLLRRTMLLYSDCEGATCATVSHFAVRASANVPISALNSVKLIRPASMPFG
eukprot:SAG31_NODE_21327_length_552_cov_1.017660_2_plen_153_part_01